MARENNGALFKNMRKEKDTHPDYRGDANVAGIDCWMSAWLKKDKNGHTYMSIAFKEKEPEPAGNYEPKQTLANDDMDDEIPFAPEWR